MALRDGELLAMPRRARERRLRFAAAWSLACSMLFFA